MKSTRNVLWISRHPMDEAQQVALMGKQPSSSSNGSGFATSLRSWMIGILSSTPNQLSLKNKGASLYSAPLFFK